RLAEQVGTTVRLAQVHNFLCQACYEMGYWDDALAEAAALPADLKDPVAACSELAVAAEISFHRDEPVNARQHLAVAQSRVLPLGDRIIPPLVLAQSLDHEQAGQPGLALAVLTRAFDDDADDFGDTEDLLADAVRLALKVGNEVAAQALTARAAALAEGTGIP